MAPSSYIFLDSPLDVNTTKSQQRSSSDGRPSRCGTVPPSERQTHRLPTEDRRSLALTLAGHPQRPTDTAQTVAARRETNSRSRYAVVAPPCTPVTPFQSEHRLITGVTVISQQTVVVVVVVIRRVGWPFVYGGISCRRRCQHQHHERQQQQLTAEQSH